MLTLPTALADHLNLRATTLALAYFVLKSTGAYFRGTSHDRDITISTGPFAGTYLARAAAFATNVRASTDGSVNNLDVEGALRVDATIDDLTPEEIEAGVYDQAAAVLFLVNWASPNDGQRVLCGGTLGEFYRDDQGRWRSEVRGLTQALKQQLLQTFSERCNVRIFGDARCKFDVASATRTGIVTAVTDRKHFVATLSSSTLPAAKYFDGARLKFTSGNNENFIRETNVVTLVGTTATISLWEEEPADVAIGDTFELPPACDRRYETCRDVHANLVNFRGHGIFASGRDALMKGVQ